MPSSKLVGAGAFVALGVVLFTVGLFMIGQRRMLFEDRFEVYTEFAKLGQIEMGAVVRVAGMDAGEVTDIRIPSNPAEKFRVQMRIREDLHGLVRTDSVATAQTEGVVGAVFVNIVAGSETAPAVPNGGTIPSREPFSIADLIQQASATVSMISETVDSLRDDMERTVQQLALTAEDAHALIEDVRPDIASIAHNGSRLAEDFQEISAKVRRGDGTIGKLMNDDGLYLRAREIADEAAQVMTNVREVSADARQMMSDLQSKDGPARGLMDDMRVTLGQSREALTDLADNMEALKRNFLFRGFFNKRGYFDLDAISPAEYRNGVLARGNRKPARIWLASRVLFEAGSDGTERLTADGKARLDSAMATYLPYIPSNALIVEGYATGGTVDERFRLSRHRASIVRDYLMSRYELIGQSTGYIGLGAEAPDSPAGDNKWDGIGLTMFLGPEALRLEKQEAASGK